MINQNRKSSSRPGKSAVCTIATKGSPLNRAGVHALLAEGRQAARR
jgi:hypothetical protein